MNQDTRLDDGLHDGLGSRRGDNSQRRSGGHAGSPRGEYVVAARVGAPGLRPVAAADPVYAALDLGTNNCRLLIACPEGDGFRVIDSFSRIIRLGEGIALTGSISEAATARAIAALGICRDKIRSRKARRLRLIATEACRAAENGVVFLERVRGQLGLELEIVDRETEATLAVAGCSELADREAESIVLFDIGGGS